VVYLCGYCSKKVGISHFSKHPTRCGGEILLDKMPSKYTRDFLLVVTCIVCPGEKLTSMQTMSKARGAVCWLLSHTLPTKTWFFQCVRTYLHCQWYNGIYMLLGWSIAFKILWNSDLQDTMLSKRASSHFQQRPHFKFFVIESPLPKKNDGIYACYFGWSVAFRQHEIEVGFINMYNLQMLSKRVSRIQSRQLSRMIGWGSGISRVYPFILSCLWLGNLSDFVVFWQKAWNFLGFFFLS